MGCEYQYAIKLDVTPLCTGLPSNFIGMTPTSSLFAFPKMVGNYGSTVIKFLVAHIRFKTK